jgi:four helix bundle protein
MLAKSVRDLEAYKVAFEVQQRIFYLTQSFPKEEIYALTDQIRRASRSIGANICESWLPARRAILQLGERTEETIHWVETAFTCEYMTEDVRAELISQCRHVGGMLNKMMNDSDSWCKNYIIKKGSS